MNLKPWKLISAKDVSVGKWFPLDERVYQKNDGSIVDDFTVTTLENVSMVIPITSTGKIVMVHQFKPGADQLTFEFPAGRLKPGQNYQQAAHAELLEETGMRVGELIELGETVTFPTKGSEKIMNYIGLNVHTVDQQTLDEHEEIEIVEFTWDQIDQMILDGQINTAPSITCWHLAKIKFPKLLK